MIASDNTVRCRYNSIQYYTNQDLCRIGDMLPVQGWFVRNLAWGRRPNVPDKISRCLGTSQYSAQISICFQLVFKQICSSHLSSQDELVAAHTNLYPGDDDDNDDSCYSKVFNISVRHRLVLIICKSYVQLTSFINPRITFSMSHSASFRTEMYTFLFWVEHCGIWNRSIPGFVKSVSCCAVCMAYPFMCRWSSGGVLWSLLWPYVYSRKFVVVF